MLVRAVARTTIPAMSTQPDSLDDPNGNLSRCVWIVFDAVGTLIDPLPRVATAYYSIGRRYGSQLSELEISQRFRTAFRTSELDGFPGGPETDCLQSSDAIELARWRWIVRAVLPDVTEVEACFQDLWDHFARPSSWRCFGDVSPTLAQLAAKGYRLAVASNFDRRLHSVCDGLPELQPIERRIVSAEAQVRKPSASFYAAITSTCECGPDEVLMVGDDLQHDVLAPRSAGFNALHLDRCLTETGANQLRSLADLLGRLPERSV